MDNRRHIGRDVHLIETKAATVPEFIQGLRGSVSTCFALDR